MIDPRRFISYLAGNNEVIPPLVFELFLRDGSRHFIHSVIMKDEESDSVVIRIWDLRAMNESDVEDLKSALNKPGSWNRLGGEGHELHEKLDWANLRIGLSEILYCIEWHNRWWPDDERKRIGFDIDSKSS
jgi:hypothetical protein